MFPSELGGVQNSLKALHESTVMQFISLSLQEIMRTFILLIILGSAWAMGILCLESFKYECRKQRSISSMSSRRIKTCRCCMELTVDTKLNITYANESATLYECNSILPANISALIRGVNKEQSGLEHYASSCKVLFRCEKSHPFPFIHFYKN